jgi:alginate O-acetyltransferase complex protein AlgI
VLFRADSFHSAFAMLAGMVGVNGIALPDAFFVRLPALGALAASIGVRPELGGGSEFVTLWSKLALLHLIAFIAPNTQEFMRKFSPALDFRDPAGRIFPEFAMTRRWAVLLGAIGGIGLLAMERKSEFLYYQF